MKVRKFQKLKTAAEASLIAAWSNMRLASLHAICASVCNSIAEKFGKSYWQVVVVFIESRDLHYNRSFLQLTDNYLELAVDNQLSCIICRKWQLKEQERLEAYLIREYFAGQAVVAMACDGGDYM